jgi:hypothetical protein
MIELERPGTKTAIRYYLPTTREDKLRRSTYLGPYGLSILIVTGLVIFAPNLSGLPFGGDVVGFAPGTAAVNAVQRKALLAAAPVNSNPHASSSMQLISLKEPPPYVNTTLRKVQFSQAMSRARLRPHSQFLPCLRPHWKRYRWSRIRRFRCSARLCCVHR